MRVGLHCAAIYNSPWPSCPESSLVLPKPPLISDTEEVGYSDTIGNGQKESL